MEIEATGGSARRRRLSNDTRDAWTGLTLGAVLDNNKRSPIQVSRTLLDIIRDEEPNSGAYKNLVNHHNNNKNWKSFKDRLFLRRAGNAWTSSVHIPTSDTFSVQNNKSQLSRRDSTRSPTRTVSFSGESGDDNNNNNNNTCSSRPQMSRMTSSRVISSTGESTQSPIITEGNESPEITESVQVSDVQFQNSRSQMLRRNSSRLPTYQSTTQSDPFNEPEATPGIRLSAALAAEREQIQRVVSSSESTSEHEQEQEQEIRSSEETPEPAAPVRMSLMDLLSETDREMGWGSYTGEEEEEEEEEVEEEEKGGATGEKENNCCVCMVRHKGAAFIPCGHTFCRLCSRELFVARGNCPLCNGFILEILDIF